MECAQKEILNCSTHFYFFGLPCLISTFLHLVAFCSWYNVSFLFDIQFVFYCRGWQGLIAQGCHSSILIIDPKTAQTIQVLEKHKSNVVKVRAHCEYFLSPSFWTWPLQNIHLMVFGHFLCIFHCNCKFSVALRVMLAETSNLYEDDVMSVHAWLCCNLWICCATMYCIDVLFNTKKEMKHGKSINVLVVSNVLIGISKNCVIGFHFLSE